MTSIKTIANEIHGVWPKTDAIYTPHEIINLESEIIYRVYEAINENTIPKLIISGPKALQDAVEKIHLIISDGFTRVHPELSKPNHTEQNGYLLALMSEVAAIYEEKETNYWQKTRSNIAELVATIAAKMSHQPQSIYEPTFKSGKMSMLTLKQFRGSSINMDDSVYIVYIDQDVYDIENYVRRQMRMNGIAYYPHSEDKKYDIVIANYTKEPYIAIKGIKYQIKKCISSMSENGCAIILVDQKHQNLSDEELVKMFTDTTLATIIHLPIPKTYGAQSVTCLVFTQTKHDVRNTQIIDATDCMNSDDILDIKEIVSRISTVD